MLIAYAELTAYTLTEVLQIQNQSTERLDGNCVQMLVFFVSPEQEKSQNCFFSAFLYSSPAQSTISTDATH